MWINVGWRLFNMDNLVEIYDRLYDYRYYNYEEKRQISSQRCGVFARTIYGEEIMLCGDSILDGFANTLLAERIPTPSDPEVYEKILNEGVAYVKKEI